MSRCGPGLVEMAFDSANPEAVKYARTRSAELITDITQSGRASVRRVMTKALQGELSPREAAKLIRSVIGLTDGQADAVLKLRADLLKKGKSAVQVERETTRYAARLLRQRAETIARTETIASANEGQRQLWMQARERGLLTDRDMRVWITTEDERVCPVCGHLDGQTATLDGKFPGGFMNPPAHPNCRCAVGLKMKRAAA